MSGLGARLRALRQHCRFSLREVEQRSQRIAKDRGDPSYQVSASWLKRLESDEDELTVPKLRALAEIYGIPTDQLIRFLDEGDAPSPIAKTTILSTETSRVKGIHAATPSPDQPPDQTTLLPEVNGSRTPYRRGIIGKLDQTLSPMIPAGYTVWIDTRNREISPNKAWTHEFQRAIYFLITPEGYVCGWCELDRNSEWLILVPHPLSPASSRRWKYRTEAENLGRVIAAIAGSEE